MTDPTRVWRERFGTEHPHDDEYVAETYCLNGCGYSGGRYIFVKKGVMKNTIIDVICACCGCPAKVV